MKRLVIIIAILASALAVSAQTLVFVENMNIYHKGETSPNVFMQANKYYSGSHFGAFAYALAGQYYGEAVAGPTYNINMGSKVFVELGIGAGLETCDKPMRCAGYIYAEHKRDTAAHSDKGKLSFLVNYEQSKSGYWYVSFVNYNISDRLALGLHAQYGAACGPRIQLMLPGKIMIWGTAGYDLENKKPGAISGLRLIF